MDHTVAPRHLVHCTSTLLGNGQFIMPNLLQEFVPRVASEVT